MKTLALALLVLAMTLALSGVGSSIAARGGVTSTAGTILPAVTDSAGGFFIVRSTSTGWLRVCRYAMHGTAVPSRLHLNPAGCTNVPMQQ